MDVRWLVFITFSMSKIMTRKVTNRDEFIFQLCD